jgi:hypothetical protein
VANGSVTASDLVNGTTAEYQLLMPALARGTIVVAQGNTPYSGGVTSLPDSGWAVLNLDLGVCEEGGVVGASSQNLQCRGVGPCI